MQITNHADDRLKERCGLNKKSKERMVQRVLDKGIKHSETKGRLNKWIISLYFYNKMANNIRIWGNQVYIFTGEKLITVINIPNNLKKELPKMVSRRDA